MTGFINKKITKIQTLGEKLHELRKKQGLSQEKVARAININCRYIKLLESDNYKDLPADVYTINILKSYADILNINPNTAVHLYKKEKSLFFKTQKKATKTKQSKFLNFFLNPNLIKYFLIFVIIGSVLIYIGWGVNKIISPPKLLILSPENNLITNENIIKIQGQTEKEVDLTINDRSLLCDEQGNFTVDLNLQKGENIIKISAKKKHSKENTVYRTIIVNDY